VNANIYQPLDPMKNHTAQRALGAALALFLIGSLAAATIPVDLPPPDARPPAKDKPVKVYILSGQSNMVGFGRVKGAAPQYGKVFLTADPSAKPAGLPVATEPDRPNGAKG
jgi:hypothetical protein